VDDEHISLMQFLRGKGLDVHRENWDDENVDWKSYQCIILKSPWDYVFKTQLFYQWLDKIKKLGILLLNSADVVKWNSDKHYLQDIADAGLKVIPTTFLERGTVFQYSGGDELIVKPCISGSSKNTFKISGEVDPVINELLQQEAMMVQPFMPEVNEEGEWSLLFFGGKFSHALLKTPAKNDFRSQPQFGGFVQVKEPAPEILAAASEYVAQFAKDCLYARVDGLIINGEFYLMELELIDPVLFLSTHEGGYENYYRALTELIC
jgi:glutathione synthase/RimK-type ligase-like ATP-grasp enzyme